MKQYHVVFRDAGNVLSTSLGKIEINYLNSTYLQTANVWISRPNDCSKLNRCIFDTGSRSSFIQKYLIDLLQIEVNWKKNLTAKAFKSSSDMSATRKQFKFNITGHDT